MFAAVIATSNLQISDFPDGWIARDSVFVSFFDQMPLFFIIQPTLTTDYCSVGHLERELLSKTTQLSTITLFFKAVHNNIIDIEYCRARFQPEHKSAEKVPVWFHQLEKNLLGDGHHRNCPTQHKNLADWAGSCVYLTTNSWSFVSENVFPVLK